MKPRAPKLCRDARRGERAEVKVGSFSLEAKTTRQLRNPTEEIARSLQGTAPETPAPLPTAPVVRWGEEPVQAGRQTRGSLPASKGHPHRADCECERAGVAAVDPKWRACSPVGCRRKGLSGSALKAGGGPLAAREESRRRLGLVSRSRDLEETGGIADSDSSIRRRCWSAR